MKIAELSSILRSVDTNSPYGIYNHIGNLCDGLTKRKHQVHLYAAGDTNIKGKLHATIQTHAASRGISDQEILRENLENASQCFQNAKKYDVIHSHFSLIGCHFSPIVDTLTFHSIHSPISKELKPHLLKYKKEKFISFSHAQRKQLPDLNWVANIYHGIDTELYKFQEIPHDYVLYLGRITEEKGVHNAIAAAKDSGVPLVIAGISYPNENYWNKHIEPHINGIDVRFVGHANTEQKIKLLKGARALLFPTGYPEAFGLVMIEAMACGTPVIGFDNGAVSEVIQHEETGYLVKTAKQMSLAIKKINKISRHATRERAETYFSLDRMATGYERVFERSLQKKINL